MKRLLATTENVAALFLLAIALLTAGNVALRDLFSMQVPDWFDGSRLLQSIALFWGIAIATYRGGHICVDIVWEHLGPRGRRWLDVFATLVTFAFLAPLAWMVWVKVGSTGTQATSDLRLPLVWFYPLGALGATVAALLGALRAIELVRGKEPETQAATPAAESADGS
ncbi:MAG: TRAP transporter small permease [Burkholderiaceae bacterium]|jgi:TRAP-type C4-dicarboxylate transport system permease small subunit|nr:TRAP transporter small permease [Burkholderiaceae bacterium]MBX3612383.1 TRAP transporter small permease [Burkholderiaceae bacterium]HMN64350.1 TRAP transporter small permease [Burkholderiaceae bacterium]